MPKPAACYRCLAALDVGQADRMTLGVVDEGGRSQSLRLSDRSALNDVNQEKNDRDDEQNVKQTAQCVAGHEPKEPEHEKQKYKKQHWSLRRTN